MEYVLESVYGTRVGSRIYDCILNLEYVDTHEDFIVGTVLELIRDDVEKFLSKLVKEFVPAENNLKNYLFMLTTESGVRHRAQISLSKDLTYTPQSHAFDGFGVVDYQKQFDKVMNTINYENVDSIANDIRYFKDKNRFLREIGDMLYFFEQYFHFSTKKRREHSGKHHTMFGDKTGVARQLGKKFGMFVNYVKQYHNININKTFSHENVEMFKNTMVTLGYAHYGPHRSEKGFFIKTHINGVPFDEFILGGNYLR